MGLRLPGASSGFTELDGPPVGENNVLRLPKGNGRPGEALLGDGAGQLYWGGSGGGNLLINGDFRINQRSYASGAATTAANQYTLDRWRVTVLGQAISWATTENTRVVTVPAGGISQIIEGANLLSGSYVLSWLGTAAATVGGVAVAKGVAFTVVGGVNLTIAFGPGTLSFAKLEQGTAPTAYVMRSYADELALCKRYFQWMPFNLNILITATSEIIEVPVVYPVEMRVAPTAGALVQDPEGANLQGNQSGNGIQRMTRSGATLFMAGITANQYTFIIGFRASLTAEL